MTAPRHLWSGDWQRESAAAAQELAQRRGPPDEEAEPLPAQPPVARPSIVYRALAALRRVRGRRVRGAVAIGAATLLSAAAAFGAVSALLTSGAPNSRGTPLASRLLGGPAWLGVATASLPAASGAIIVDVVPGSPADAAGLQPGEVITEIDNHPVNAPADLESALARLRPGQHVQLGYQVGASTYTTQVTLQSRPSGP